MALSQFSMERREQCPVETIVADAHRRRRGKIMPICLAVGEGHKVCQDARHDRVANGREPFDIRFLNQELAEPTGLPHHRVMGRHLRHERLPGQIKRAI